MINVLFVCLGNICRSPLAEAVFRRLVAERGLSDRIRVDSAGTGGWHAGEPPDRRMRATAQEHGVSLNGLSARTVRREDLEAFDYVFAMDRQNLSDLLDLRGNRSGRSSGAGTRFPEPGRGDVPRLFRNFDPAGGGLDVPDPYYGGERGFEDVYEIVDRTCRAILDYVCEQEGIAANATSESEGKGSDASS